MKTELYYLKQISIGVYLIYLILCGFAGWGIGEIISKFTK